MVAVTESGGQILTPSPKASSSSNEPVPARGTVKERMKPQDIADLKQLIDFLKENKVAEFEVDRGDLKIRLKFNPAEGQGNLTDLARLVAAAPQAAASAPAPAAPKSAAPAADSDAALHIVKSPIVGTYYGSPSPGASPFVAPGDRVEKARSSASSKP